MANGRKSMPASFLVAIMVAAMAAAGVRPAAASTSHVVGGQTAWTIPSNASFYSDWAAGQTFAVGDKLVFTFPAGQHDVIEVPKSSYDACSSANQIGATLSTSPATITISSAGTHYYICGVPSHCSFGQKLAITVAGSNKLAPPSPAPTTSPAAKAAPTPAPMTSPAGKGAKTSPTPSPMPSQTGKGKQDLTPSSAPSPARMGKASLTPASAPVPAAKTTTKSHVVGGQIAWSIPPNSSFYADWAATQTFAVGDKLVFNFPTGQHDVIEVPKSSYDSCSSANQIGATLQTAPATLTITSAGTHYYICGVPGHCSAGQKVAVTVGSSSSSATPAPNSGNPGSGTPTTPISLPPTAPASSSSAVALSSVAAAAVALLFAVIFH